MISYCFGYLTEGQLTMVRNINRDEWSWIHVCSGWHDACAVCMTSGMNGNPTECVLAGTESENE